MAGYAVTIREEVSNVIKIKLGAKTIKALVVKFLEYKNLTYTNSGILLKGHVYTDENEYKGIINSEGEYLSADTSAYDKVYNNDSIVDEIICSKG